MVSTHPVLVFVATLLALHSTLVGHSSVGRWVKLVSDKHSLKLASLFCQQQFNGNIKRSPTKGYCQPRGVANKN